LVFEGKKEEVGLTMLHFVDGWRTYVEAMESQKAWCRRKSDMIPKWKPPKTGFFKVNVDDSTRRDAREGVGVVVRDSKGNITAAACRSFKANWEVEIVEAYAVFFGLRICWQARLRMMELETDSKQAVDALNGRTELLNYTSIFIHDAITLGA